MDTDIQSNNRRIAKNTLLLYVRMIVLALVNLYASRVVLQCLGVSDFGLFDVVGGVIGMLNYLNTLLAGGTSRFLTIPLGAGDMERQKRAFATAGFLCLMTAVLILLLGETVGLWFVNTHLNVEASRLTALNWVYQCALATSVLTVIQSPFTASVIAHEKMGVYAAISVADAVLKLALVMMLTWSEGDRLILYAQMLLAVSIFDAVAYQVYCRRHFEEARVTFRAEASLVRDMCSYSGWNMIGAFAGVMTNYGVNIVLNIFFGTMVNGARGIAMQVNGLVQQFYSNFQMASRPQIFKYYSQHNEPEMFRLIVNNSKYSAYLLLLVLVPVGFNIHGLLGLWLGQVPQYTVGFVWLSMVYCLLCAIEAPLGQGMHAIGKMKLPNCVNSLMNLMVFPLSYLCFHMGMSPYMGSVLTSAVVACSLVTDMWLLKHLSPVFSPLQYVRGVYPDVVRVLVCASLVPMALWWLRTDTVLNTLLLTLADFCYVVVVIVYVALPRHIRGVLLGRIKGMVVRNTK